MKHSILFKVLAIFLCAVSLMGLVGSAAGVLVLVQGDLYKKTVDQVLEEKLRSDAAIFAEQLVLSSASKALGGCPEEMTQRYATQFTYNYGYSIQDTEGNIIVSVNPELKESAEVFQVPVTGQYMHLVSTETEAQKLARETAVRIDSIRNRLEDQNGQTIPSSGIPINQVIFTDRHGTPIYEAYGDQAACNSIFYYGESGNVRSNSSYDHAPQNQIGFLYYGTDDRLMYRSFLEEWDHNFSTTEVFGVMFLSHESGFLFQTEQAESLGVLLFDNGYLCFNGYAPEESPAEVLPEETVPATTAETVPQETAAETTVPEETQSEETKPIEDTEENHADDSEEEQAEEPQENKNSDEEQESSSASAVPEEEKDSEEPNEEVPEETEAPATEPPETLPPETLPQETVPAEPLPEETVPQETGPVLINGKPLETYQVNRMEYVDSITGDQTTAKYVYLPLPELIVEMYVDRNTMENPELYTVLHLLRQYRGYLLPILGSCLLLFVLSAIYLCNAAGRKSKSDELRAGGLNRIPLDLYLILGVSLIVGAAALADAGVPILLNSDFILGCSAAISALFVCCLIFTGFCYAFAAQVKTPNGFWWHNLLCIRFVFLCMRVMQRLEAWLRERVFPRIRHLMRHSWARVWKCLVWLCESIERTTTRTGQTLNRFFSLIPMTWQWLLGGLTIILFALLVNTHHILLILMGILVPIGIVLYATHCFGLLSESAKRMGRGDLDNKAEDKLMVGCFRDFATYLNDLADAASVAAQNQLKSERMKTELITNVSHDIKTPLTSIINYVDLLQKPHTDEDERQYLDVLDRQSQRLKKLVEDLMDMSKASTGNMEVEITRVDAVESVNQALGEFSDKLERAHLYPVFRHNENSVPMMADGKLVWRVLSNLLGNVVKYGMPGTRIYLDLAHVNGKVIISLKNISREELNVTAEELMERFVRGDVSRNTEGSGLGLNIAKSLMELQKGSLQLLVDGDLFKVTLIFPDAQ